MQCLLVTQIHHSCSITSSSDIEGLAFRHRGSTSWIYDSDGSPICCERVSNSFSAWRYVVCSAKRIVQGILERNPSGERVLIVVEPLSSCSDEIENDVSQAQLIISMV
ncbi:hypothetical protein AVEN_140939-1 [Araneus ventricosus]|uniref:Uncharacterized protein n=1 Tax=Araneus ventricosus TaxID=182803 RepID=A0A4Y2GE05_ARAVE|nr:hypothetical protein AVEN_140939-1 [Araneus ventricosus]